MLKSVRAILDENETSQFLDHWPHTDLQRRKQSKNPNAYKTADSEAKTNNKDLPSNSFTLAACQISGSAEIIKQIAAYSTQNR